MTVRIEFTERVSQVDPYEVEKAEDAGLPPPVPTTFYRRIYVRLGEIFAPKELPGKKKHCAIEFYDGTTITVKGSYDEICTLIEDRERQFDDIGEIIDEGID